MSQPTNLLIFIHGMTSERIPPPPGKKYEAFWKQLVSRRNDLPGKIRKRISVEWGNDFHQQGTGLRDDQKVTHAEQFIHDRVSYDAVRTSPGPNNALIHDSPWPVVGPFLRKGITSVRERVLLYGVGDVVYYVSAEGEWRVRSTVYQQILKELVDFEQDPEVRLHVVSHSLGVAVAHDFLFGLFNTTPGYDPSFPEEAVKNDPDTSRRFNIWRDKAAAGTLRLGSFTSMASQLPLFVMRKQTMVEKLHAENLLDPAVIGLKPSDPVKWQIFYDIDDILGFPTRSLYYPNGSIKEIQVDCGDEPLSAHSDYWANETVLRETAELIWGNC